MSEIIKVEARNELVARECAKVENLTASERVLSRGAYRGRLWGSGVTLGVGYHSLDLWATHSLMTLGAPLVFGVVASWYIFHAIRGVRIAVEFQDAAQKLLQGSVSNASRTIEEISARTSNWIPRWRAYALVMRGGAAMFRCELDQARRYYVHALASGWLTGRAFVPVADAVVANIVMLEALMGNTQQAQAWADSTGGPAENPRFWLPARATLQVRQGSFQEALGTIDRASQYEGTMTGAEFRPLRLLRVFCEARLANSEYRKAPSTSDLAALTSEIPKGSLDYMVVNWPELREFGESKGFLDESPQR